MQDPATGAELGRVADAAPADCLEALGAAAEAQAAWAATAPRERSRILRRGSDALRAEEDRLAMIGTRRDGLTPREVEVLDLIVEGATNRVIAERLVISEKTAIRHTSNIFRKLGIPSRAEAVRVAFERGLLAPPGDPG